MLNCTHPDLVILSGTVITVDVAKPEAQAVAVKSGRILAVGQDDELRPLIGKDTRVIDARGKTVIPGLIDAHCHPNLVGRMALQVDCRPNIISSISLFTFTSIWL